MKLKKILQPISNVFTSLHSWTGQMIKLSIIAIVLILILCLWVSLLVYLLRETSATQLYAAGFYGIFYLVIWGILPALGIRFLVRFLKSYSNKA
ncbi:MAG: hypothetical protein AAFP76_01665 [Bacteroidota bacterium]